MKFKGKIHFNVEGDHPDMKYIKDANERLTFEDTYTFNTDYNKDVIIGFIKNDLSLVAGGGYSSDHISNIEFDITRMI